MYIFDLMLMILLNKSHTSVANFHQDLLNIGGAIAPYTSVADTVNDMISTVC